MHCGWEGNCRSGVALAMRHRLSGMTTYGLSGLWQEDECPAYTPVWTVAPLPLLYHRMSSDWWFDLRNTCWWIKFQDVHVWCHTDDYVLTACVSLLKHVVGNGNYSVSYIGQSYLCKAKYTQWQFCWSCIMTWNSGVQLFFKRDLNSFLFIAAYNQVNSTNLMTVESVLVLLLSALWVNFVTVTVTYCLFNHHTHVLCQNGLTYPQTGFTT